MSFNLTDLMVEAQKIQENIAKLKRDLKNKTIESQAQDGSVQIVANGYQEIVELKLNPAVFPLANREELEKVLLTTINQALTNSKEMIQQEISKVTGGLTIPGLKDLL